MKIKRKRVEKERRKKEKSNAYKEGMSGKKKAKERSKEGE